MRNIASLLALGAGLALAFPLAASADTFEGHFSGHAVHNGPAPGVYAPGVSYTARLVLNDTQVNPWYPFDPSKEYTAVIHATVFSYFGGFLQIVDFANAAQVFVYEDTGTAADYANPATFTDGTVILSGGSNYMFGQRADVFAVPWNFYGTIVFTGGAGLGNLASACSFGLTMNDFVDFQIASNPAGYQEAYDAEWKCAESISVEEASWGSVKTLYR
jgi:hypothetical protein